MRPIFGSTKYLELKQLEKHLKKAKTKDDIKRFQNQINLLEYQIKKEELEAEEYFNKM